MSSKPIRLSRLRLLGTRTPRSKKLANGTENMIRDPRYTPRTSFRPLVMWTRYTHLLSTRPLPTKIVTGTVLAAASDLVAQAAVPDRKWDPRRTLGLAAFGACYSGFFQHFLFDAYARVWPIVAGMPKIVKISNAVKLTLTHQLFSYPCFYFPSFFFLSGVVGRGSSMDQVAFNFSQEFPSLYKTGVVVFTPAMFIQFFFVPLQQQVLFKSCCSFLWTVYMSWQVCGKDVRTDNQKLQMRKEVRTGHQTLQMRKEVRTNNQTLQS